MTDTNTNTNTTSQPSKYSNQNLTASTTITVPPRYIGSVIGGAGKTLKEIKEQTHTRIRHLYPDPHNGHLLDSFRIVGSPHNVDQAQKWIRRVIANTWRKDNPSETQSTEDGEGASNTGPKAPRERPESSYYEGLLVNKA